MSIESDVQQTYDEFWRDIVERPDGSLDVDQVKRELHDYRQLLREVPKVYMHVTGGKISKPNTRSEVVIAQAQDYMADLCEERM